MLKNKLYVYGDDNILTVPSHTHYGKYMLHTFQKYKDTAAIINAETSETLSFSELSQQIVNIALSLTRMGVRKGDVISVCSEKRMEFIPTVMGIICAGATFAPTDITCGRASILHRINLAKPRIIFCSPSGYDNHRQTLEEVATIDTIITYGDDKRDGAMTFKDFLTEHADVEDFFATPVNGWEDIALILYSSGTTGLPKGIPLTHSNLLLFLGDVNETTFNKQRTLITREWYYSYGLGHTLFTLHAGSTVVYCPRGTEVDFLEAIQTYKINTMQLTPTTVVEMLKSTILDQYDVSSLQYLISASITFDSQLVEAIKKRFPNLKHVSQYYGMSEAGCLCHDRRTPKGPKPGSVGCATESFIFKIIDLNSGEPLGPNQRGEICFKSPTLMKGYIGDTGEEYMDEEGFFKTGDIGYYDEDKYFFIVDRVKELIKFNSYQVAPAELEAVLLQHPAVRDAGVVGAPHEEFGQVPTAFVVLQPNVDITSEQIVQYVDSQVSARMRLAGGVRFVQALPRSTSSKLNRKDLLNML
ncbi:luciferin 4-monooxygenase-like [Epargyreus clarus]|uniref:luciferin 4-monooxygenase-like n=1 Tax=Epargyreus clarus TaxID=520877 RepID=UPI003C2D21DD